jgi:hypothetical protein
MSTADQPRCSSPLGDDPECPGCKRTMRLVGTERHHGSPEAEVLTFECECGQLSTSTTNQ